MFAWLNDQRRWVITSCLVFVAVIGCLLCCIKFCLVFLLSLLVQQLFPMWELLPDFLSCRLITTSKPGVLQDLVQRWSLGWVEEDHALEEVFEFIRKVGRTMRLPEGIVLLHSKCFVMCIWSRRTAKRSSSKNHHKSYDPSSKDVHLCSMILLLEMNLWCHIIICPKVSRQLSRSIPSFCWCCEAPISNL